MNRIALAHLALLSLNLIYAANHLLAKGVTPDYLGPNGFIIFRMGITTFVFVILHFLFVREKVMKKDLPLLAITGIFGVGLSQLLFFNGIAYTSAMNVGVLLTSIPIFVVILSYFSACKAINEQIPSTYCHHLQLYFRIAFYSSLSESVDRCRSSRIQFISQ